MLRRTKGLNAAYLLPLASYVVFCRLSELQVVGPSFGIAQRRMGPCVSFVDDAMLFVSCMRQDIARDPAERQADVPLS